MVDVILRFKPEVDILSKDGFAPLHLAAMFGHVRAVTRLLDAGADINARTVDGATSLHLATRGNHPMCVQTLVVMKADLELRDKDMFTAEESARQAGPSHEYVADYLKPSVKDPFTLNVNVNTMISLPILLQLKLLPPANDVCEGYVFTPVCQSFCSRGGRSTWAGTPRPGPGTLPGPGTPPRPGIPPEQCMPGYTGNKRAVRILLESILVYISLYTPSKSLPQWVAIPTDQIEAGTPTK